MDIRLNGILVTLKDTLEITYKNNLQRSYVGSKYLTTYFGMPDVSISITIQVLNSEYQSFLNNVLNLQQNINFECEDYSGIVAIKEFKLIREHNVSNVKDINLTLESVDKLTSSPKSIATTNNVTTEKNSLEKSLSGEFVKKFQNKVLPDPTSVRKQLTNIADTFNKIVEGGSTITNFTNNLSTRIFTTTSIIQSGVDSARNIATAVTTLKQSINTLTSLPSNVFNSLLGSFKALVDSVSDNKFLLTNLINISELVVVANNQIKSIDRDTNSQFDAIQNDAINTINNTTATIALASAYIVMSESIFETNLELNQYLQVLESIYEKLNFDDITILNKLQNIKTITLAQTRENNATIPVVQEVTIDGVDNIFNILYQQNDNAFLYLDYVIKLNRLKDINNISGTILIPIVSE